MLKHFLELCEQLNSTQTKQSIVIKDNIYTNWLNKMTEKQCHEPKMENELQTDEMINSMIDHYKQYMTNIPDSLKTEKICLKFIEVRDTNFQYIPKELQTEEFLIKCVQINGDILKYIKRNQRTETICREAIKNNPKAFEYLSKKKFPILYEEEVLKRL